MKIKTSNTENYDGSEGLVAADFAASPPAPAVFVVTVSCTI
jgi:hypothetical protein